MDSTHVFIGLLAVLNLVNGVYIKGKKGADGVKKAPVNGGWGDWILGECPVTCGGGSRKNYRKCNNPIPQNGGAYCTGSESIEEGCNPLPCPVDGGWNDWVVVGECSEPCGGGVRTMSRECNNPYPQHGGAPCVGPRVQSENCNQQECPVDCIWGEWEYGDCSEDCGWGMAPIMRIKVQREMFGGRCEGVSYGQIKCHLRECDTLPVHCEWDEWIYGACSVTCGGGTQWNTRVVAVAAENGGEQCQGDDLEIESCNTEACPPIAEPCVDTYHSNCVNYVWACTDTRYPWFRDVCRKTCDLC